jgi:hypothetical protein
LRPPSHQQSALLCPLNHVLGTEANVRVMRALSLSDIPISIPEIARLTMLQPSGVARVCEKLEDVGAIEAVGRTRNRQFRISSRFALTNLLVPLFATERSRAEQVMQAVTNAAQLNDPHLHATWLEGPAARDSDSPGDPLVVGALVDPDQVENLRLALWERLLPIQRQHDVLIELRMMTRADLQTASPDRLDELKDARPLFSAPPLSLAQTGTSGELSSSRTGPMSHEVHDARSLAFARSITDRLKVDPSLVDAARRYIDARLTVASQGEKLELLEWRDVLSDMSVARLRRFLVEETPRATRLRQSLPFMGALSEDERAEIMRIGT